MTEEEAIEWAKALLQDKEKYAKYHSWVGTNTFVSIQTLLNLIEKQQRIMKSQEKIIMEQEKEIDKYKKQEFGNLFNGRYISKDKIKDNIKELEILKITSFANNEISKQVYKEQIDLINMQINVLKELLEEE